MNRKRRKELIMAVSILVGFAVLMAIIGIVA